MNREHVRLNEFQFSVDLLQEKYRPFLRDFSTGTSYPERGLGDFLQDDAFDQMLSGEGVSYLVFRDDSAGNPVEVIAYFTLSASSIPIMYQDKEEDGSYYNELWGLSAIKINMFAVKDSYQDIFYEDKPISAWVFEAIIGLIDEKASNDVGIRAVYLYSLESAFSFYKLNGMRELSEEIRPLDIGDGDGIFMFMPIREYTNVYIE